jgi:ribosome-associated protein
LHFLFQISVPILMTSSRPTDTIAAQSSGGSAAPRSAQLYQTSLSNAVIAAHIADQLRGQNIVVLDLTGITSIVDFFIIATGTSGRQMHAIADEVNRKLKHEDGNRRVSIEGYRTEGNWILVDYGDVVLHVFTPEGRQLYNLEQLWADAPRIDWKSLAPPTRVQSAAEPVQG